MSVTIQPTPALLANPEQIPLFPPETVLQCGRTLVVAPHPDDESLGCGGLLALLQHYEQEAHVLVMSDGSRSHPNSRRFPRLALRNLRERETVAALTTLGIGEEKVTFLRFPDREVPTPATPDFEDAVSLCRAHCAAVAPQTILLPWRRDPHCDHRATYQVMLAGLAAIQPAPRVLEYPIWVWMLAEAGDSPTPDEVQVWRLDTSPVLPQKQSAIAAHRSQTTDLVDDDPDGFRLLPEHLVHFLQPWEVFFEANG